MARELLNVPPQIGYKQPYPMEMYQQNQYYAPAPIPQGSMAPGDIINALRQVQMNPGDFSKDEIEAAKQMSLEYFGKPLEFKDDAIRMGKNAAFDFVDTLAFGLIPDKIGPDKLTSSDEVAGMIGSTAGFFVPGIGPMATGTRLASKILPSIAKMGTGGLNAVTKLAGEGAGKVVGEGAGKALGGVTEWLGSQNAAARVGSMVGAGFNFEDGINPMGAALGAFFPAGTKGLGAVSKADDVLAAGSSANSAKAIQGLRDTPLGKEIYNRYVNGAVVYPNEYSLLSKQFGVPIDEIKNIEEVIRRLVKGPSRQVPLKSDMLSKMDEVTEAARNASQTQYNAMANVRALPQRGTGNIEGVAPVNIIPNNNNVIPVGVSPINPIVQSGKATLAVTPEMRSLVQTYARRNNMSDEEILSAYNLIVKMIGT